MVRRVEPIGINEAYFFIKLPKQNKEKKGFETKIQIRQSK